MSAETAGLALAAAGGALLVVAAFGVLRLPDALTRQHAATKAVTFAVNLVCVGAALAVADAAWTWRLACLALFLSATLPVASHALARAAVVEGGLAEDAARAREPDGPGGP